MRLNLPGYIKDKGRGGKVRHRVRVEGNPAKRIAIPFGPHDKPAPGQPPFMEHYLAARAGQIVQEPPKPKHHPQSLDALIWSYLLHLSDQVDAGNGSPLTHKQRTSLLTKAANFTSNGMRMGEFDRDLHPEAIEYIRDQWGMKTAQADNCVKAMKSMYTWARTRPNPASNIARVHQSKGGTVPWTSADVKQFLDCHGPGTMARRWLFLTAFTGARRDDLPRLGRSNEVKREGITFLEWRPRKKGSKPVAIPVLPQLHDETRATKVIGSTYLLNANGVRFKNGNSLGTWVAKRVAEAKLENRSSHGLRKALATLLAEMGCSTHQIMAVLSHTKPQTSAIYTDSADRIRLAAQAMDSIKHVRF